MNKVFKFSLNVILAGIAQINFAQPLDLDLYASGFTKPLGIEHAGDGRLFIVEQSGKIKIIDTSGHVNATPFLNITGNVNSGQNEQGLLGLVFHPDYASNGFFYVNYTALDGSTQISRFTVDGSNPDLANVSSEVQILNIAQPYANHNGGNLEFGTDGYLYIGTGDGGSAGDPGNRAQNPQELLGKMLRIDVDNFSPYGIPASNPFVGSGTTLEEIWAIGLRNPWRFSFDALTADLWIADVGQNSWEEINFQTATSNGGENYGWRCYEGNSIYNNSAGCPVQSAITFPIYAYSHSGSPGGCAVTGGVVYRSTGFPSLYGRYLFSDNCNGWIMSIHKSGGNWVTTNYGTWSGEGFSSFGEDNKREVYVAALFTGKIYKIVDSTTSIQGYDNTINFNIYPNPFEYEASIKFKREAHKNYSFKVFDLRGTLVESMDNITGDEVVVTRKNLKSGMYLFSVLADGIPSKYGKLMLK